MLRAPMYKRLLLVVLLAVPVAAWALYKPVRILAPAWVPGVTCVTDVVCTDDVSRYPQAADLYEEALRFVDANAGAIAKRPRAVFCAEDACFRSFGFNGAAARTVGVSGIVVSPRGWMPHYIRHEMIHHLQAERMGVFGQWRGPQWFIEGMAYSLSEDPRAELSEPWQTHRAEFERWLNSIGKENLWAAAGRL